jgi:hypothetical protein
VNAGDSNSLSIWDLDRAQAFESMEQRLSELDCLATRDIEFNRARGRFVILRIVDSDPQAYMADGIQALEAQIRSFQLTLTARGIPEITVEHFALADAAAAIREVCADQATP